MGSETRGEARVKSWCHAGVHRTRLGLPGGLMEGCFAVCIEERGKARERRHVRHNR